MRMDTELASDKVTRFCLICGQHLPTRKENKEVFLPVETVIKEESVVENHDEGNTGEFLNFDWSCSKNKTPSDEGPRPFVSTNDNSVPRRKEVSTLPTTGWSEDDKAMYQWFLIWLKVNVAEEKGKRPVDLRWDQSSSGKDTVPFCPSCKIQLQSLVELQRKVEELEGRIKDGILDLKEKANSSEPVFRDKGIYTKDIRYGHVRKEFVTSYDDGTCIPKDPPSKTGTKRKSTRIKTAVRRYNSCEEPCPHSASAKKGSRPVVVLSTCDKTNAEKYVPKKNVIKHDAENVDFDTPPPQDDEDCDVAFVSSGEVSDIEFNPYKTRKKKSSKRTKRRRSKPARRTRVFESQVFSELDEMDGFNSEDEPMDNNWTVRTKSRNSSKRPSTKIQKRKELEDDDWTMDVDSNDGDSQDDEEEGGDEGDEDDHRKNGRYLLDTEKHTLTYKSLVFQQLSPFTDNKYQCLKCNAEIEHFNNSRVRSHYLKVHTKKYACKLCEYRTDGSKNLKAHVRRIHDGIPEVNHKFPCNYCGKPVFRSKRKGHEWTHKNEQEKRLALDRGDSDVPWQHKGGRRHQCDQCGRKFLTVAKLNEHKEYAHGSDEVRESKKELCPECGERYMCLKEHRRRVHGVDASYYTCLEPGCGIMLKSLAQLKRHKDAVHRKIRPHKCSLCPREFSNISSFQSHMNLHNGIRPFQCEHCPSAFTTKAPLQRHVNLYHGEGPVPRRKAYTRGPTMLGTDVRKRELINKGKYLPPSALASWAAGREPTSHFPLGSTHLEQISDEKAEIVHDGN